MAKKRILIVAAHPDDEILGCGGMIAQEIANGAEVKLIILADGIMARYEKMTKKAEKELKLLYKNSESAIRILGIKPENIVYFHYEDIKLNAEPIIEIIQKIRKIVQKFRPHVVYTHHCGDYNPDHKVTFDATIFATRPYLGEYWPKAVYSFEVLSSTEWAFNPKFSFRPNVYVVLDKRFVDKKKKAMKNYLSEIRPYPHPRSEEGIEVLAKKRGNEISENYAEAFELVRLIKQPLKSYKFRKL